MSYISAISKHDTVYVWERNEDGERIIREYDAPYYFYIEDEDGPHKTIYGDRVSRLEFLRFVDFKQAKQQAENQRKRVFETDIPVHMRVLSNWYYGKPAPKLNMLLFDIEVDYDPDVGFAGYKNPYAPINSVAGFHYNSKELFVFTVPPDDTWTEQRLIEEVQAIEPIPSDFKLSIKLCKNEKQLLVLLLQEIEKSDLICGWNSDFFDVPYLGRRIEKTLGEDYLHLLDFQHCTPKYREVMNRARTKVIGHTLDLQGRIRADYMNLYKKFEPGERSSYKLSAIEQVVGLNLPKLEYEGSLHDLYRQNFAFFIRYNIRDTEILNGFEDKLGYIQLANELYHLSTGLFSDVSGTLKLAEYAIINYCHYVINRVVPNAKQPDIDRAIAGAFVLEPKVGMHELFGSIDINSLYPSAIRSINISPETLRGQFVENVRAAEAIARSSLEDLTFVDEETGHEITKRADEWREWLLNKKWAISGYGTVFDQTTPGIIPSILADWYDKRKHYQALKKQAKSNGDEELADYYDRLQYVFKIKLNSLYGALTNLYFRFYDLRMGESTTGTGRMTLRHQCAKTNEVLGGPYDYTGDAIIYGDTDSTYFKTYASSPEEAIEIADAVADAVNASYPQFMKDTFLVQPGFENIIKAGREIVSDRGIFVEKKRYILHLIDLDGEPVDKLKIMGLDTKKTILPKEVSDAINKFIERLLKGEDWSTIAEDIVQYKEDLRKFDNIMSIGLPKGVHGLEERQAVVRGDTSRPIYFGSTRRVKSTSTSHEANVNNINLPGHVAAAIHYNLCLEMYGDRVSMTVTSGTKIKVFYLKNMIGRFKSIALPTDLEVVPDWFKDNYYNDLDIDAHIDRLVDKPLTNILKAIGKKPPSKQQLFEDSLFVFEDMPQPEESNDDDDETNEIELVSVDDDDYDW